MEVYGESFIDIKNVQKWCREFASGRTAIHDERRTGIPSISDETVVKIERVMHQDWRITLDDLCISRFPEPPVIRFYRKVEVSEGVRKMGPTNADGRPQTTES